LGCSFVLDFMIYNWKLLRSNMPTYQFIFSNSLIRLNSLIQLNSQVAAHK
jgi:hypothetical protein